MPIRNVVLIGFVLRRKKKTQNKKIPNKLNKLINQIKEPILQLKPAFLLSKKKKKERKNAQKLVN